jgi:imidazolonepropionase-like amidohydrolase
MLVLLVACGDDGASREPSPSQSPTPTRSPLATQTTAPVPSPTVAAPTQRPSTVSPEPLAIVNARILDGTGGPAIERGFIVIRDGRIDQIGGGDTSLSAGMTVIDAAGKTAIPGLIDGHVHVSRTFINLDPEMLAAQPDEQALVPFLQDGFTTLRDVATATVVLSAIKLRVDSMTERGLAPQMIWSGPMITTVGGYPISNPRYAAGGQEITSPEEGAALVDKLADAGARVIKLGLDRGYLSDVGWPLLSLEEVQAISQRAHERGLLVTAHVTSLDELRLALDGGVDSLAHTPLETIPDDMIQEMLNRGVGMVTTATIWPAEAAAIAAENAIRYAGRGGVVSIGTDFGCCQQVPGSDAYLREAEFLLTSGMTPQQILTAATRGGAIVSGLGDETGTLEARKEADIVLLDGNPTEGIDALRNVDTVIADGRVVFGP